MPPGSGAAAMGTPRSYDGRPWALPRSEITVVRAGSKEAGRCSSVGAADAFDCHSSALLLLEVQVGVPEEVRLDEGQLVAPPGRVHAGPELLVERPEQVAFPGATALTGVVGPRVRFVVRVEAHHPCEFLGREVLGEVRHRGLGRREEGVLDSAPVVPEVVGRVRHGLVPSDVLAPEEADPARLPGVATGLDNPLRGAVARVPAALVEQMP